MRHTIFEFYYESIIYSSVELHTRRRNASRPSKSRALITFYCETMKCECLSDGS